MDIYFFCKWRKKQFDTNMKIFYHIKGGIVLFKTGLLDKPLIGLIFEENEKNNFSRKVLDWGLDGDLGNVDRALVYQNRQSPYFFFKKNEVKRNMRSTIKTYLFNSLYFIQIKLAEYLCFFYTFFLFIAIYNYLNIFY